MIRVDQTSIFTRELCTCLINAFIFAVIRTLKLSYFELSTTIYCIVLYCKLQCSTVYLDEWIPNTCAALCNRGPRLHLSAVSVERERKATDPPAHSALVHAVPAAHCGHGPKVQLAATDRTLHHRVDGSRGDPPARRMSRPPHPSAQPYIDATALGACVPDSAGAQSSQRMRSSAP